MSIHLRKIREDRTEYEIYNQIVGSDWALWRVSNHNNPTAGLGASRLLSVVPAKLYPTTVVATLAFNSSSRVAGSGSWFTVAPSSVSYVPGTVASFPGSGGETATYTVSGRSSIAFRHVRTTNSGKVWFVIRQAGVEIPAANYALDLIDGHREHDLFVTPDEAPRERYLPIAVDLDPTLTYTVEVISSGTKNASSAGFRVYDGGLLLYDPGEEGIVGTDVFLPDYSTLILGESSGSGNLEYAVSIRQTTDTDHEDFAFVTGGHGFESALASLVVQVDGATISFAGAAGYATWTGDEVTVSFTTQAFFSTATSTPWANLTYSYVFNDDGCETTLTRTTILNVTALYEYVGMLMGPNLSLASTYGSNNVIVAGHLDNYTIPVTGADTTEEIDDTPVRFMATGGKFRPYLQPLTNPIGDYVYTGTASILVIDRSDDSWKAYMARINYSDIEGRLLPTGDTKTFTGIYRIARGLSTTKALFQSGGTLNWR